MTTSILPARYKINGLINTDRDVMENMEQLCLACGSFLSYDLHAGKWAVIINQAGNSVRSFDNSNIIGPIQVNGTSLNDLYNAVSIEYPLRDTVDQTDFVQVAIPVGDRYDNEPDNVLKISMNMMNEPVQAEILALIQLKQSRIDQVITFQSDYSVLNLNAGDIISVTNDIYQFNAKPFRIISLREVDTDSGAIQIEITALAYDANVYDISDLGRYIRSDRNGIKSIGALGTPLQPVIYIYAQDRRPGMQVEAVVPSGIVESMELWLSSDNSTFNLIVTLSAPPGQPFTAGSTVLFDYDQLESQNIYVKVRAVNATTTGPFSAVRSFLSFVPQQITDVIGQTSKIQESNGTISPLLITMPLLLSLLDGLNAGTSNTMTTGVLNSIQAQTGNDLTNALIAAQIGSVTVGNIRQSVDDQDAVLLGASAFVAPRTGSYQILAYFDQNGSGARGGRGSYWSEDEDYCQGGVSLYNAGTGGTIIYSEVSGGTGAQYWQDFVTNGLINLNAGQTYRIEFDWVNYTESTPNGTANVTVGWQVISYQ